MKYSVQDPYTGVFDYYDVDRDTKINDDRPVPSFPDGSMTKLGVASLDAARPLPSGAKKAGSGKLPIGVISSGTRASGLAAALRSGGIDPSGLGAFDASSPLVPYLLAAASALLGFAVYRRYAK